MSKHRVASVDEIEPGERIIVEIEGKEIGIFNIEGEYRAYLNWCAHQAGPTCEGNVTGTTQGEYNKNDGKVELDYCKQGEILNCPWHGWEYDLTSGECLSRQDVILPQYKVEENEGDIILSVA